jgi:hypothetical protein
MTSLEAVTIESSPYPKLFVIEPHKKANNGNAVPIDMAPTDPKNMSILSYLSANLNSCMKETDFYYCFYYFYVLF